MHMHKMGTLHMHTHTCTHAHTHTHTHMHTLARGGDMDMDMHACTILSHLPSTAPLYSFVSWQVAALDGVHFAMRAPSNTDVPDPLRYHVSRKDEYALLCTALCDADRRIMWYDISKSPTTHDSLAWAATPLGQQVAKGALPAPFFINADSAFSLSPSMITPSGERDHDDFDFHQSSNRMAIECTFGMLIQRWGILWRPLRMRFDRRAPLIGACIRLHSTA